MTEVPSPQLRISDQERESALNALGEHMSAGRIDIDEFGERSARITAAKTRGELGELFTDLPVPHPVFGAGATAAPSPAATPAPVQPAASGEVAVRQPEWSPAQRAVAALTPLVWVAAIALIATGTAGWPVIFAPIALTAVGRALWGKGFEHHDHHHHDRHRERREEFRAMRDEHRRQRRLDR
ncbi:DUF1707 SHOCT-like domain-containing protein [Amycolatopsis echigonensis]|uniref:DUF1707 domain-containing protein n=1 Tax=Amycolatopsis echigonensis TaxID=2576905 RepID=A0A8E1W006_9PSEU|nr:DUF1707 domain-containing protein [Amycolatopsis echigonensis]MBB2501267.1 DUF1707 domain-containing protein [Amycolatopsis echigonensis]